ncbi:MAG: LPS export ABC transporter periplasmic protein LptC, partial [Candidatus Omnitrophica bacterium]|nr:LPS export ABC transporter periplasmic protein LptC [Candidatus Omnitrophota bacterium]
MNINIKMILLFLILFLCLSLDYKIAAQEYEQSLSDFNLSGFTEKGKKSWEIYGKSADIFNQTVNIKDVVARLYRNEEDIELRAKEADFNKTDGSLTLKDDVVISTTKGASLNTESLNWDRTHQRISTKDKVDIQRNNIIASALGAFAEPDLKKINLEKEVVVQIHPQGKQSLKDDTGGKITITCDGPMEIDYDKNRAIFYNNVKIVKEDIQIYSDRLELEFLKESIEKQKTLKPEDQIKRIHAFGNVRIIKSD